jgi:8-oxo-dGTP diphosphatase
MNPPYRWAFPGGFIDYGEPLKTSTLREALEETGLVVYLLGHFDTYSDPDYDSRQHNISTVFVGQATGEAQTGLDAQKAGLLYKKLSFSTAGF